MEIWHYLIILAILSFLCELFTIGFVFGSMGVGFLLSAILSYLGTDIKWQILIFSFGIIITYFLIRPLILKFGYNKKKLIKTNNEALINKFGVVTQEINIVKNTGRVKVDGDDWSAITNDGDIIKVGTKVKIIEINSIVLTVKPLK